MEIIRITAPDRLFLASGSPRRAELLAELGIPFEVLSLGVDETPLPDEPPEPYVRRIVRLKLDAAQHASDQATVLVADTTVALGARIFGKPLDRSEARRMLAELSGREHLVLTGVGLARGSRRDIRVSISRVRMNRLSPVQIERYVATGEPDDKAGAYAIQGLAAAFADCVSGSRTGVVGLPLEMVSAMLKDFGFEVSRAFDGR